MIYVRSSEMEVVKIRVKTRVMFFFFKNSRSTISLLWNVIFSTVENYFENFLRCFENKKTDRSDLTSGFGVILKHLK